MNTLLFGAVAAGMIAAMAGSRRTSVALFLAGFSLAVVWLAHHATGTLPLEF